MTRRKKLIEVALPLEAISDASAKEKNIHTGLPANMHTWWSRKPLAASRAIIFASLVDDPSSDPSFSNEEIKSERLRLFKIIERLVYPTSMNDEEVLNAAYEEILKSSSNSPPPLFDPFAGGGSIPLEAIRLGLEAYATDLNPVSVIINKAMIELTPKFLDHSPVNPNDRNDLFEDVRWGGAEGLIADIKYYGEQIVKRAHNQIGHLYPKGPNGEDVISWIWVRTVKCQNPVCGVQMPLVKKFWVSTHKGNEAWVKPIVDTELKTVGFGIKRGGSPQKGTITNTGANCIVCNTPVSFSFIRDMGQQGQMGYKLMCIVVDGSQHREYLPPSDKHITIANSVNPAWVPETDLPEQALGFRVQNYGITKHRDLFTPRQLVALTTFADLIGETYEQIIKDSNGDYGYANAIVTFLALAVDRLAQTNNTLVRWRVRKSGTSKGEPAFDRQIVPMIWEFSEGDVFGKSVGSWQAALTNVLTAFRSFPILKKGVGKAYQHDATTQPKFIPNAPIISTDPPYFDNIGYADLSDFYYIWLRRTIGKIYPDLFSTLLSPKQSELTAANHLYKGDSVAAEVHFLEGIKKAFRTLTSIVNPDYPVTIYYAFRETERFSIDGSETAYSSTGWENMLEALIDAGFLITGTWPIKTEAATRLRALASNALASSVVFCCRPRPENALITSRREFVNALRRELPLALREMQSGNIAPVDLAQASIGPGMAVYSRYSKVLEPDGSRLTVRTALQLINHELDAFLAEQEGDIDADSRFAVAWFEQFGFKEAGFGQADVLARAKNTSVGGLANSGLLESGTGKVRLLHWSELDPGWNPATDSRLTVWEATHHLILELDTRGESGAAQLLAKMPPDLAAEARQLAYRLYSICERKGWANHARDYNALVISWSASQEQAAQFKEQYQQGSLF